jgi:hypothetical protein
MRIAAQHLPIFVASDERKPFYGKATMSLLILWRRVSGLACCEAETLATEFRRTLYCQRNWSSLAILILQGDAFVTQIMKEENLNLQISALPAEGRSN